MAGCWGLLAIRKAVREVGVTVDVDWGKLDVLMLFLIVLRPD